MNQPRVTVHQTDAAEVDAAATKPAAKPGTITDARGRKIVVKILDPVEFYRLGKMMGAAADSEFARNYASVAAAVRELDGEEETFPNSEREIEAMLTRLGHDGLEAANEALGKLVDARPKRSVGAAKN